jgi:hypothetical protein
MSLARDVVRLLFDYLEWREQLAIKLTSRACRDRALHNLQAVVVHRHAHFPQRLPSQQLQFVQVVKVHCFCTEYMWSVLLHDFAMATGLEFICFSQLDLDLLMKRLHLFPRLQAVMLFTDSRWRNIPSALFRAAGAMGVNVWLDPASAIDPGRALSGRPFEGLDAWTFP